MHAKIAIAFLSLIGLFGSQRVLGQLREVPDGLKHRLIVLADMGNERDEEQQMMHLLMYSNEFDLEGLVAVSGIFLNPSYKESYKRILHPELFDTLVRGYSRVYDQLRKHANGWPSPEFLKSIISSGQRDYGIDDVGEGRSSPGSELIVRALKKNDPRALNIVVNAGSNTLAQAIADFERTHTREETIAILAKLIVYENGSQDDAGAWIVSKHPEIRWIRSNYQTYAYAGPGKKISDSLGPHSWQPYSNTYEGQHAWARENIQTHHGTLGALYPDRILRGQMEFLEGGGTTPWLGLITRGLSDPRHPEWGGWSGRYSSTKRDTVWSRHKRIADRERTYEMFRVHADTVDLWRDASDGTEYQNTFAPILRWRRHIFEDLKARMDWCVQPFDSANHNPVAVVNGNREQKIIFADARPGQTVELDASASYDPDKDQTVSFFWWIYPEAGTYRGDCSIMQSDRSIVRLKVPGDAAGTTIHVILDVSDDSPVAVMHDYRRVVIRVENK